MFGRTFLNLRPHGYLKYHILTTDLPLTFQETLWGGSVSSRTLPPHKALLAFNFKTQLFLYVFPNHLRYLIIPLLIFNTCYLLKTIIQQAN